MALPLKSGISDGDVEPFVHHVPGVGGARPGAGRKKKSTAEQQAARRDAVIASLPPAKLRALVAVDLEAALAGETSRIDRWLPYVLGSPRSEIAAAVAADIRISFTVDDDRARPED